MLKLKDITPLKGTSINLNNGGKSVTCKILVSDARYKELKVSRLGSRMLHFFLHRIQDINDAKLDFERLLEYKKNNGKKKLFISIIISAEDKIMIDKLCDKFVMSRADISLSIVEKFLQ